MTPLGPARFAVFGSVVSAVVGTMLAGLSTLHSVSAVRWGLTGWFLMALVGVAGGAWTVSVHGDPRPGFLAAVGTCMLLRLVFAAAGALAASTANTEALYAFLIGLGAGYVPLQVFEMSWFLRRNRLHLNT